MGCAVCRGPRLNGEDLAALRRAEELLPYKITRQALIQHLRGQQDLFNGAVEFYAAYQSAAEFAKLHPKAAANQGAGTRHVDGVAAANLIIANDLAVPDEAPENLLERAVELATRDSFCRRRRNFYDWQLTLLDHGHSPQVVARELKQLVHDYNSDIMKHFGKVRWERAFTVVAVLGAGLGVAAAFAPGLAATFGVGVEALKAGIALTVAGNAATIAVGKFQLTPREPDGAARVAVVGAMFHDIAVESDRHRERSAGPPRRAINLRAPWIFVWHLPPVRYRTALSHDDNEQAGKFQHNPAIGTCRIGAPDLIAVLGGECLAHRRIERREKRSQPRALEPFDHARGVSDDVMVVSVPDVDAATERTQQIIVGLRGRQIVARRIGSRERGGPRPRRCNLFHSIGCFQPPSVLRRLGLSADRWSDGLRTTEAGRAIVPTRSAPQ
jgi:hypothetical protein